MASLDFAFGVGGLADFCPASDLLVFAFAGSALAATIGFGFGLALVTSTFVFGFGLGAATTTRRGFAWFAGLATFTAGAVLTTRGTLP